MADLSGFGGSGFEHNSDSKVAGKGIDAELQGFLMQEQQKAQLQAQVHQFNDLCWEKCVEKPGIKLDSRTETCLNNCVDRFIDVSMLITNRFSQLLQKSAGGF
ncbi:mitochondrial import inner membrane translocase subunit Tim8-like [Venturia canescens]|uniref:mitochondrial import inner membrane translocase subunit Tim8-like n=1 Tax=Venturia canescens TaxID=32260 RepID=UPI001C9C0F9E|nr:mitochondrial import inner membrane translocase subunit Tim8-like [Venturia canescens]